MKKSIFSISWMLIFSFSLFVNYSLFAVINVTDEASLISAINTANGAPDTISFSNSITISTTPLPTITNTYTIEGNSNSLDGSSAFRGFIILGGSAAPTIQNLTITNTLATGGDGGAPSNETGGAGGGGLGAGGAIYVGNGATATLDSITYTNCDATGGDSPTPSGAASTTGGSGAGGLGGAGAFDSLTAANGGGGGGILLTDDATNRSGAGGGADGANSVGPADATSPTYGGGGGGAADVAGTGASSAGAFGGGGGGGSAHATDNIEGATGGFGGGGGGAGLNGSVATTSTFAGGAGGTNTGVTGARGGGGAALGGAIFVDDTSTATLRNASYTISGSTLTAGTGAASGSTAGTDIFMASGSTLKFDTSGTITVTQAIESDTINDTGGIEILDSVGSGGVVRFTSGLTNTFRGTITLTEGTWQFGTGGVGNANSIVSSGAGSKTLQTLTSNFVVATPITVTNDLSMIIATDGFGRGASLTSALSGAGKITLESGALAVFVAAPSFSGGFLVDGASLRHNADASLGTGAITLTNGGGLRTNSTGTTIVTNSIIIDGSGSLAVRANSTYVIDTVISEIGVSNLTFSQWAALGASGAIFIDQDSTYTGTTTISNSTVLLRDGDLLSSSSVAITPTSASALGVASGGPDRAIKTLSGNSLSALTLTSGRLVINQGTDQIFSGNITGAGNITKSGAANLTFDRATAFSHTGNITVDNGKLILNSLADLIATSGSVIATSPGILEITASTAAKIIQTLSGSGTVDMLNNNLTVTQGSDLSFSGVIQGTGNLTKNGASTLTLTGANTYSGGTTTVSAGTLAGTTTAFQGGTASRNIVVSAGANLTFNQSTTGTFGNIISSAGSVTKEGTGTVILSNASNTYSGGTIITAGTLQGTHATIKGTVAVTSPGNVTFDQAALGTFSNVISGTGSLTKIGADVLVLDQSNTYTGTTTISVGTLRGGAPNVLSTSTAVNCAGGVFDLNDFAQSIGSLTGTTNTTLGSAILTTGSDGTSTSYSGVISETGGLTKVGAGTFTITGTNTYSGGTTVSAGTLAGTTTSFQGGTGGRNISVSLGANLTFDQAVLGTFGNVVSGAGNLIKSGVGTLILSNTNTYTGTTTISTGVLQGGAANVLSTSTAVNCAGGVFDLNDFAQSIGSLTGTTNTTLGSALLTTGNDGTSTEYFGVISETGGLTKVGAGTFSLRTANTYTGATTISAGTLQAGSVNTNILLPGVNGSAVSVLGTAVFDLNNFAQAIASLAGDATSSVTLGSATLTTGSKNTSTTYAGVISETGGLTKVGSGTFTLSGTNTYTGTTTISAGTLQGGAANVLSTSTAVNCAGGVFDLNDFAQSIGSLTGTTNTTLGSAILTTGSDGTTTAYSGVISETGALTKVGAGTFTITGTNTYSGGTTVSAGTLTGTTTSFQGATAGRNIENNATLTFDQSTDGTFGNNITQTGMGILNKNGTGKVTLTGVTTQTTTNINAGSLIVNNQLTSKLNVLSGGKLEGTGTITGNVDVDGSVFPGNSIGTINIVGDYTQKNGSTLEIEFNNTTTDLVNVTGSITIEPTATISLVPSITESFNDIEHIIMSATTGVTGTFINVTSPSPSFSGTLDYSIPNQVRLTISAVPFSNTIFGGNPGSVAKYLDGINPASGNDLSSVYAALEVLNTNQLRAALNMMYPAIFKGAINVQHFNGRKIAFSIERHLDSLINSKTKNKANSIASFMKNDKKYLAYNDSELGNIFDSSDEQISQVLDDESMTHQETIFTKKSNSYNVWGETFYNQIEKKTDGEMIGYRSYTGGFILGNDNVLNTNCYLGPVFGYIHSDVKWKEDFGKAHIDNVYAGLYSYINKNNDLIINASLIGAYNHYKANRNIVFTNFNRTAKNTHHGAQIIASLYGTKVVKELNGFLLKPFAAIDYTAIYERGYTEKGAGSINLKVNHSHYHYLKEEAGFNIAKSFGFENDKKIIPQVKLSYIRQDRLHGTHYTSAFVEQATNFRVFGISPTRNNFSPGFSLLMTRKAVSISINYNGEFGKEYRNNDFSFYLNYGF